MEKTFYHNKFTAEFTDKDGYFSLTGAINEIGSGAIGKEISSIDNRFKLVNALHLSDCETGEPAHSVANAIYFAEKGDIEGLKDHLRISEEKAEGIIKNIMFNGLQAEKEGERIKENVIQRIYDSLQQIKACLHPKNPVKSESVYKTLKEIYSGFSLSITKDFPKPQRHYSFQILQDIAGLMTESLKKSREIYLNYPLVYRRLVTKEIMKKIVDELRPTWKQEAKEVYKIIGEIPSNLIVETDIYLDDFFEPGKVLALANFLKIDFSVITATAWGTFSAVGQEYYVLTAEEAEESAREYINNYIDECLEIPESMAPYFNREKYIIDALNTERKGDLIASYDGKEIQQNGYFIYRIN